MKIALDLDNVIVDILVSAREALASDIGIESNSIIDTGIYEQPFTHEHPEIRKKMVLPHEFWQRDDVLVNAPSVKNAVKAVKTLDRFGLLCAYITRRPDKCYSLTKKWLKENGLPERPLYTVGHEVKDLNHDSCKADVCRSIGATHLIDDSAFEIESAIAKGINGIIVDHPLAREKRNIWIKSNPRAKVVKDLAHAVDMLIDSLVPGSVFSK